MSNSQHRRLDKLEENTPADNEDVPSNLQELYEDEEAMKGLEKFYQD